MATFIGFNTIGQNKQFTAVDFELIKIDLLNAFNIRQGELVGRPGYGTLIWDYLFENQLAEVQQSIINEIQRVAGGDPRIFINNIETYPQENGILIDITLQTVTTTDALRLSIFFNQVQRSASYV
jgi:phage baseplate assembly protein W